MQPEINTNEEHFASLSKVTPVSKYLAMALFIIMPFIGGWIGYNYAPEKVVEVDKVIIKEVEKEVVSEVVKNSLSALSIKKGDVFNNMVVEEVSSYFSRNEAIKDEPSLGDVSVSFLGETTLVGTLTIDTNFDFISDFTPESMEKLPRLDNSDRYVWFRFLNPEIIQTVNLKNSDRVEVVIDEYIYSAPTEASNEARIVRSAKID
jgi:hypothetical protein